MLPTSVLTSADVSIKLAIHLKNPQLHENALGIFALRHLFICQIN